MDAVNLSRSRYSNLAKMKRKPKGQTQQSTVSDPLLIQAVTIFQMAVFVVGFIAPS